MRAGADGAIKQLSPRARGMIRQYTEARTVETPIARQG
jgi:hypothetical protein